MVFNIIKNYMTKIGLMSKLVKVALVKAVQKGTVRLGELKQGSIKFRKLPKGNYRRVVGGEIITPEQLNEIKRELPEMIELNYGNECMLCWFTFEDLMKEASIV
jgi:hypothetical protein